KPSRVTEIKKLIEHAVYVADRTATALVEEDFATVKTAAEQYRAANELHERIHCELVSWAQLQGDAQSRANLLSQITSHTHDIIQEAGQLMQAVTLFLEKREF